MNTGVYEIVNSKNGHRYIGSAVNLSSRWRTHRWAMIGKKGHNNYLQNAWYKHGAESFLFRPILYCSKYNLIMYEQLAIDKLKPEYNLAPKAGSVLGIKRSIETRAKLSAALFGKRKSPEQVAKMSAHRHSEESKAKMSAALRGRVLTEEWRKRIGLAQVGNKKTPAQCAAISARQIGIKRKPLSVEHNAALKAGAVRYWKNKRKAA